jgi:prephenate dehydrogenase
VVAALEAVLPADRPFVGAHPIAGSERGGAAAATADLFRGAPCILTPTARTPRAALARVRALWEGVGARVDEMTPEAHDRALAFVSHLPHVVAYALVRALGDPALTAVAGGSWRDATRVAESRAELWGDILLANAAAVVAATDAFAAEVARLRSAVVAGDAAVLTVLLEEATSAKQRQSRMAAAPRPRKAGEP